MSFKIKIDKADRLFSFYIRERDNWRCVRCHTPYERSSRGLGNSHYFGRGHENTRFDPENCDTLCTGCHSIWEKDEYNEYEEFKIKQLGEKRFHDLKIRSLFYAKKDRWIAYQYARQLLKDLLKERGVDFNSYIKKFKL